MKYVANFDHRTPSSSAVESEVTITSTALDNRKEHIQLLMTHISG